MNFLEELKKETAEVLYCPYCLEPKGDKFVCCEENHFVAFKELPEEEQNDIIESELHGAWK